MKSSKMLFRAASLIPLIVLNAWLRNYLIHDDSKITFLLVVLLIVLSTDMLVVYIREQSYDKQMNYDETKAKISCLIKRLPITAVYLNWLTLGILLLLAAWLNIYVVLLLIGLVPIEVLSYKLLNKELVKRSKIILEQTSGWQDILAVVKQTEYLDQSGVHRVIDLLRSVFIKEYPTADWNKGNSCTFLHVTNIIARTVVIVLAIYDMVVNPNPFSLVLYVVLLPLFQLTLNKINGSISKMDLINSINFVAEMKKAVSADK